MRDGQIPGGAPTPFKRFAEPVLGKMLQPAMGVPTDVLVPFLKAGHVTWAGLALPEELPEMWAKPDDIRLLHPAQGDLLVCEGGEVGRAGIVATVLPENTIIQNSLHLIRPGHFADVRYLKYALEYVAASGWLDILCNKATIAHLTSDKLRELRVPYQKPDNQERIANFLDEQTARIDALIAEKERLVGLLREHWLSIVSYAVGADNDAVTVGWKDIALKRVTLLRCDGPFGSALASAHYVEAGARVIRLQNIRFGEFDPTDAAYIDDNYFERELTYHAVEKGDLLIAGLGDDRNYVGRACVAPDFGGNALVKADCFRFRLDTRQVVPEFVAFQLSATAQRDGGLLATGSTRQRIPLTVTESRKLKLPPYMQQVDIVVRLVHHKKEHRVLEHHCVEHITRLREYRSSLISAAVTGQLDIGKYKLEAA